MSYAQYRRNHADIIIIGAGISGMVAAYNIWKHEPSLDVLILEANPRIGGRTFTTSLQVADKKVGLFDLGGQWLSSNQTLLMNLLNELDAELIPQRKEGKMISHFSNRVEYSNADNPYFGSYRAQIELCAFISDLEKYTDRVSIMHATSIEKYKDLDLTTVETFIRNHLKHTENLNFIRHVIKTNCGVDPSNISMLYYLAFCNGTSGFINQYKITEGGREFRIKGGASQICEKLVKKIGQKIKLNEAVLSITQKGQETVIETINGTYACKQVIVAIPPKEVLKVKFEPELPQNRLELLKRMQHGNIISFVVTYEKAFWTQKGFSGHVMTGGKSTSTGPVHMCYDVSSSDEKPALSGYICVPDCFETISCSSTFSVHLHDDELNFKEEVLNHLAFYFGPEALNPIGYEEKCWWDEKYIGGGPMSCPGLGTMADYNIINKPIGRIFWAGTETASYWNGYMAGAVIAGHRAAVEVLYEVRPQALTISDITEVQSRPRVREHARTQVYRAAMDWRYWAAVGFLASFILFKVLN